MSGRECCEDICEERGEQIDAENLEERYENSERTVRGCVVARILRELVWIW